MGHIIGIDLGTTNSVVAVLDGGEPRVITNEEGARLTPSVVGFQDNGEVLVGEMARRQVVMNPNATVYSIKRFMGRRHDEIDDSMRRVGYDLVEAASGDIEIQIGDQRLSPPEISARILQKLKRAAELHLGEPVTEAVITVPAYFNDAQRKATRDAGEIAGLEVRRIINEPTAAALAYGLDRRVDQVLAVFDLGGGTFDISILEVGDDVVEVLSSNGDSQLGGDNIDDRIVDWLVTEFRVLTGIDVSEDRMVMQRLREAAERAKIELSSMLETEVNLPFLTADANGPKHLNVKLTRSRLDDMIEDLVEQTLEPCRKALADAGRSRTDIDEVILVGGSTRIPLVQKKVTEFFGKDPHRGVNPDEVVAMGAAVQGGVLGGALDNVLLLDVTPLTLGLETRGGVMAPVIERNTTIPTRRSKIFSTVVDNQAAVQLQVFQGEREFVKDNRSLGRFELGGIPPMPRATPQIEVSFEVDANGILTVTALEKQSGKRADITIEEAGGLTQDEIRRAVQDAEAAADKDKERRQRVDRRNTLQGLVYGVSRQLREIDSNLLDSSVEREAEDAVSAGRGIELSDEASIGDFDAAIDRLAAISTTLAELTVTPEPPPAADGAPTRADAPTETEAAAEEDVAEDDVDVQ